MTRLEPTDSLLALDPGVPTQLRLLFLGLLLSALCPNRACAQAGGVEFFEKKIRPVLVEHCYSCHSAQGKQRGGMRLDTRDALRQGGDSGPALVPGKMDSLLLQAIRYTHETMRMPPKGKLPAAVIADLEAWVKMGAPDPRDGAEKSKGPSVVVTDLWSLRAIQQQPIPRNKDQAWPTTDIDRFLLAELEKKALRPVRDASSHALVRRVYFDLTGLPPRPSDLAEFDRAWNANPQRALENLVDRLLATPEFGERWARHWLDVARYADSTGGGANWVMDDAWRYRDWVIDAFHRDLPFDQFIMAQIAGDLLPTTDAKERQAAIIATGFLQLGPKELAEYDVEKLRMEIVDEQVDTIGRAFLGLTIGCARCHDHKFDPIPTREYHALAGILRSTTSLGPDKAGPISQVLRRDLPVDESQARRGQSVLASYKKLQGDLTKQRGELKKLRTAGDTGKVASFEANMRPLERQVADLRAEVDRVLPRALAVAESPKPANLPIFIRGDLNNKGPVVARGFLESAFRVKSAPVNVQQSGRLELAKWVASPDNPLTSRVIVNRVWHWLMGAGLVATVDNFGVRGEVPSHPELLDHLAHRFKRDGWSLKRLIREIMLSHAYRLGSDHDEACMRIDPENRLLWRHERRRLEAEEIRDAVLFVSGDLDRTRGGSTNTNTGRLGFEATQEQVANDPRLRRSVYLPVYRGGFVPDLFQVFDFPDSGLIAGRRNVTTIPSQALFLMNSDFMRERAACAAKRFLEAPTDAERLANLYLATLARPITAAESRRAQAFLNDYRSASVQRGDRSNADAGAWTALCHILFASNDFLFVE